MAAVLAEPGAGGTDRRWAGTQCWEAQLHDRARVLCRVSFHRRGSLAFQLEMGDEPGPAEP